MSGLRVVRHTCPKCGAPLAADRQDIVYFCTACRSGCRLTGGQNGEETLAEVEVRFVAAANVQAAAYLPFWLLPARVTIKQRQTAGGSANGLVRFFSGEGAESGGGSGDQAFAIPAFDGPLPQLVQLAERYTAALPKLGEKLGEKLVGGRLDPADAEKLAHFVLIASEAEKPDTLQNLDYSIQFGTPWLLGVPFVARGEALADAFFGLVVEREPATR